MKKTSLILLVFLIGFIAEIDVGSQQFFNIADDVKADMTSDRYKIVIIAKWIGAAWFTIMEEGALQAGKDLSFDTYLTGPAAPDPAQQIRVIEDIISKDVDAICVIPNDADALIAVFEKARKEGILILTHESPKQKGADWDIESLDNRRFAIENFERIARFMNGKGRFAVFVGALTVPLHNYWADVGLDYIRLKYPKMELVTERIPCSEDSELAYKRTLDLLVNFPDIKGIVAFGSLGPIGAAQALKDRNIKGKIGVVGTAFPSQISDYVKEGYMTQGFLWNPKDTGYVMTAIAKLLLDKEQLKDGMTVPGLKGPVKISVNKKEKLIVHDAMVTITKDNVDQLGF